MLFFIINILLYFFIAMQHKNVITKGDAIHDVSSKYSDDMSIYFYSIYLTELSPIIGIRF